MFGPTSHALPPMREDTLRLLTSSNSLTELAATGAAVHNITEPCKDMGAAGIGQQGDR